MFKTCMYIVPIDDGVVRSMEYMSLINEALIDTDQFMERLVYCWLMYGHELSHHQYTNEMIHYTEQMIVEADLFPMFREGQENQLIDSIHEVAGLLYQQTLPLFQTLRNEEDHNRTVYDACVIKSNDRDCYVKVCFRESSWASTRKSPA